MIKKRSLHLFVLLILMFITFNQNSVFGMQAIEQAQASLLKESELQKVTNAVKGYMIATLICFFIEGYFEYQNKYLHWLYVDMPPVAYLIRFFIGAPLKGLTVYSASALNRYISKKNGRNCNVYAPQITSLILQGIGYYLSCSIYDKDKTPFSRCSDPNALLIIAIATQVLPIIITHILDYKTSQTATFQWSPACTARLTAGMTKHAIAMVMAKLS
ncbi:hypothetical protein FJ366_02765 [Candidatus Dependentiae bacterium]|nr:hypothetical protein [Candidatus Dependentiae bacterium]